MQYKKLIIILILILSGALGFSLSYYRYLSPSPVSDVQTIQTFHYPNSFVNQLHNDPQAGEKIFKEFCSTCHRQQPLIDVHAPRIGDKAAWKFRRQLSLDVLLAVTVKGVGAMPSRGGCFECSDEQLRETIRYILNHSE